MAGFSSGGLADVCSWAGRRGLPVHLHLQDAEWRHVFAANAAPVHYELPSAVRSISIAEGLLNCGYQLYRDLSLRDAHFDVGYEWQTAYLSPNEGGSGAATPLYVDFCTVMLGWRALGTIAREVAPVNGAAAAKKITGSRLVPTLVPAATGSMLSSGDVGLPQGDGAFDAIQAWAKERMGEEGGPSRESLERLLVHYQRNFLGGKHRELEALTTGGGTRSINLAFEASILRARAAGATGPLTVLTGNPHLAVERAERRFGFTVRRIVRHGALCPALLAEAIGDPSVIAVYSQTLSYTDGISDDLEAIVDLIEAENAKRQAADVPLVTLINDSCLAFCVLVHNDGTEGAACLRVLELTASRATPTIVTLDAHKHLGTDKGVSTVLGSLGTLSHLRGHVRVGAQPAEGELVRALADMLLVGVDGYVAKYHSLAAALEAAAQRIQSNGMAIVHAHHRAKGSTVIACEDPSAVMTARLKKLGHSFAYLFNLAPDEPHACQTGWSLSLTPHCLRLLQPGRTALDVFLDDLVATHKQVEPQRAGAWHVALFKESSLLGTLLAGGTLDPFLFSMLWKPGFGRALAETVVRRLFSSLLDSGVTRSHKLQAPLRLLLRRLFLALGAALALLIVQARRARKRRLLRHR